MLIDIDLPRRGVIGELLRREAASLRVASATKSGGPTSNAKKELNEHATYLETTADMLVGSFEQEKIAPSVDAPPISPETNGKERA